MYLFGVLEGRVKIVEMNNVIFKTIGWKVRARTLLDKLDEYRNVLHTFVTDYEEALNGTISEEDLILVTNKEYLKLVKLENELEEKKELFHRYGIDEGLLNDDSIKKAKEKKLAVEKKKRKVDTFDMKVDKKSKVDNVEKYDNSLTKLLAMVCTERDKNMQSLLKQRNLLTTDGEVDWKLMKNYYDIEKDTKLIGYLLKLEKDEDMLEALRKVSRQLRPYLNIVKDGEEKSVRVTFTRADFVFICFVLLRKRNEVLKGWNVEDKENNCKLLFIY